MFKRSAAGIYCHHHYYYYYYYYYNYRKQDCCEHGHLTLCQGRYPARDTFSLSLFLFFPLSFLP